MGIFKEGRPLSWQETKRVADHVRAHGIQQFIHQYHKLKDRQGDVLKWGDEIEYMLVKFNHKKKTAKVSIRAHEVLNILKESELADPQNVKSLWRPEAGAYMIEGTPGQPYGGLLAHMNTVEANMRNRRKAVEELLLDGEEILSITSFPRLGCKSFTDPLLVPTPNEGITRSLFFPDGAVYSGHPRYILFSTNLRERRGEKVAINLPIYKDRFTKFPVDDSHTKSDAAKPDHIYMDASCFGMGCCCLQVTLQTCNVEEARLLHDQLTPLGPIMLALTAAAPAFRGFLSDNDCRWNTMTDSCDCRTKEELGLVPLHNDRRKIEYGRYYSTKSYISSEGEPFNDIPLVYDEKLYDVLRKNDIDHLLALHFAHLFIRDPITVFSENVHQNDEEETDLFETIQSTNWQTVRFKPPPPNSDIGWRVEFRPCEVQITDFENAAFACFIVLVSRIILSYKLNLLIPISKVEENIEFATKRNAVLTEKFWFQNEDLVKNCCSPKTKNSKEFSKESNAGIIKTMTINEIINGKIGEFPGLIPLINKYLSCMDVDADAHCTIQRYLKFIEGRASGEILTAASWIRKFVTTHPNYKFDSVVSERINYDLMKTIKKIQCGEMECPELLGSNSISKSVDDVPPLIIKILKG